MLPYAASAFSIEKCHLVKTEVITAMHHRCQQLFFHPWLPATRAQRIHSDGNPQVGPSCQHCPQEKGQGQFCESRCPRAQSSFEQVEKESVSRAETSKATRDWTTKGRQWQWQASAGNVCNPGNETSDGSPSNPSHLPKSSAPEASKKDR